MFPIWRSIGADMVRANLASTRVIVLICRESSNTGGMQPYQLPQLDKIAAECPPSRSLSVSRLMEGRCWLAVLLSGAVCFLRCSGSLPSLFPSDTSPSCACTRPLEFADRSVMFSPLWPAVNPVPNNRLCCRYRAPGLGPWIHVRGAMGFGADKPTQGGKDWR